MTDPIAYRITGTTNDHKGHPVTMDCRRPYPGAGAHEAALAALLDRRDHGHAFLGCEVLCHCPGGWPVRYIVDVQFGRLRLLTPGEHYVVAEEREPKEVAA